jgi:type III restriction enzyme
MILAEYQTIAVEKLVREIKRLLSSDGQKTCVFQAPTGSGKTVMVASWLEEWAKEQRARPMSFLWISTNELHIQSKEKLEQYLADSSYTLSYIDEINTPDFGENQIVFANWASLTRTNRQGDWTNVAMRDGDIYKSLRSRVEATQEEGRDIVLIVDESHETFWSAQTQQFVDDVIKPRLIVEVSATPKIGVSQQEYEAKIKAHITVPIGDVIKSGLIKEETVVNAEIGTYKDIAKSTDDALIAAALAKRKDLLGRYKKTGVQINPLVLIQLPSERDTLSAVDLSMKERLIKLLKDEYDITFENGKLAMWLTGVNKENLEGITDPNNKAEVLIFKTAIAKGWDCPRADILVMLREIQSIIFKVQTVGRIMRMLELKHYADQELNRVFVYTNVPEMSVETDDASKKYFALHVSHRRKDYKEVELPSVYLSRSDYGDLTYKFREIFIEKANERFGIKKGDNASVAYKKVDVDLELYINELQTPVLADAVIKNIDQATEIRGEQVSFDVPADEIKYRYAQFAKIMSLPFAPIRSHTKIQEAFYDWFDDVLGFGKKSRLEIQRIIVCSEENQKIFASIIENAKDEFRVYKKSNIKKKVATDYVWDVPEIEYLNDSFESVDDIKKYATAGVTPRGENVVYLQKERSAPEKSFENFLEDNGDKIDWWYKNGESKKEYFGIAYELSDGAHTFYPDYIVRFKNGKVGIFETKHEGDQEGAIVTKAKAEALQEWISKQKRKDIIGGIAIEHNHQWLLHSGKKYNWETGRWAEWKRLEF